MMRGIPGRNGSASRGSLRPAVAEAKAGPDQVRPSSYENEGRFEFSSSLAGVSIDYGRARCGMR